MTIYSKAQIIHILWDLTKRHTLEEINKKLKKDRNGEIVVRQNSREHYYQQSR